MHNSLSKPFFKNCPPYVTLVRIVISPMSLARMMDIVNHQQFKLTMVGDIKNEWKEWR